MPVTETLHTMKRACGRRLITRRGSGLLEVVIAMPIVLVALGIMVQMISSGTGLRKLARENWIASSSAQTILERMRNEDFRDLFLLYNADPLDDPGGPGTAQGNRFPVEELESLAEDGMVGEIVLPTFNAGSEVAPLWQVREDLQNSVLGTPRDLNGDSMVDDQDHAHDFTALPIEIVLRWRGAQGAREHRVVTVMAELYQ